MRILHFSDPHLQLRDWRTRPFLELGGLRALSVIWLMNGRGRRYDGAAARLKALGALGLTYDHAICTGDFTQLSTREEMEQARAALEPLASDRARFTGLAGNHDRYPEGFPLLTARPVHHFEEFFPEQATSDLPDSLPVRVRLLGPPGGLALLSIDSAVPHSWPMLSRGKIERGALDKLQAALEHPEVRARCALVLTHHAPLRAHGRFSRPLHLLIQGRELMRVARAGGAQAILAGHVHERYDLPETSERPRILCAGSSTDADHATAFSLEVDGGKLSRVAPIDL